MNEIFKSLLLQVFYYGIFGVLILAGVSLLLRGFFFKYLKVRASLGRRVLVQIIEINRHDYAVGDITEGKLVFTQKIQGKKERKEIAIKDANLLYRGLGITWANFDSKTNNLINPFGITMSGFDAVEISNMFDRLINKPSLIDNKTKILILMMVLVGIISIVIGFMTYKNYKSVALMQNGIQAIQGSLESLKQGMLVPGG